MDGQLVSNYGRLTERHFLTNTLIYELISVQLTIFSETGTTRSLENILTIQELKFGFQQNRKKNVDCYLICEMCTV